MGRKAVLKNTKLTPEQQELISNNYMLVWKLFNHWRIKTYLSDDDLYDVCVETLLYSVRKFDKSKGTQLSTFMFRCVRGFLFNKVRDNNLNHRKANINNYSFDKKIFKDAKENETLLSKFETYDNYNFFDRDLIETGLAAMTDRERECIIYTFYYDKSLEDIKKLMGFKTKQSVVNTKNKGIKKMRAALQGII